MDEAIAPAVAQSHELTNRRTDGGPDGEQVLVVFGRRLDAALDEPEAPLGHEADGEAQGRCPGFLHPIAGVLLVIAHVLRLAPSLDVGLSGLDGGETFCTEPGLPFLGLPGGPR